MNAPTLPDIAMQISAQAQPALDFVGMQQIALPVQLAGTPLACRVDAGVSLDEASARGIHMSRLYLALQDLEQHIGASTKTIGRIFLKETGLGYQQWRQQWRLMRVIELLATGRSLGYCAFELGFASDSALIAFFKGMTGTTPRSYFKAN